MFNHNIRPVSGHLKADFITPEELALRVRTRRKRRIVVALLCTSMLAGASVLALHKGKAQTMAQGMGDAIVAVTDLVWPDGSELNGIIPTAGGNFDTQVALDTALDAMALQQLAMMAPEAGSGEGEGSGETPPDQGGTSGPSGGSGWGSGPNFPGSSSGSNPPSGGGSGGYGPMSFGGGSGGGSGGGGGGTGSDGTCNPSDASDPDCSTSKSAKSDGGTGEGGTGEGSTGEGSTGEGGTGEGGTGEGGTGEGGTGGGKGEGGDSGCLFDCIVGGGDEEVGSGDGDRTTSVPEPASLALFGAALAAFGIARRRRKS